MRKRFCSAITCMDGRIQLPVIRYLQGRFDAEYVDTITEAGPNLILAEAIGSESARSIVDRLTISTGVHDSVGVAVVGHHDCARNPAPESEQIKHIQKAVRFLRPHCTDIEIIGLWVDSDWAVYELKSP